MDTKWVVYILECSDGSYYTGIAIDLERRVKRHNEGKASKYTRSRLPVKAVWWKTLPSKSEALRVEAMIKKYSRSKKEAIVSAVQPWVYPKT